MDNDDLNERVRRVIELGRQIFIFSTVDEEGRPHSRYMATLDNEEDYSVFFMGCKAMSNKVRHIAHNPNTQLLFAAPDFLQVASVSGKASVENSIEKKRELWEKFPVMAGYFSGPDDPDFVMIRFVPEYADYLNFNTDFDAQRVEWGEPIATQKA